jgi:hypothetical protein
VNAHLNSYLQHQRGAWQSFHSTHISALADLLDEQLPDGYYVLPEQSLQLRESSPSRDSFPEPDVTVFARPIQLPPASVVAMTLTSPSFTEALTEHLEFPDEAFLDAVLIYSTGQDQPVCRIELLSPSNKPHRSNYRDYWDKRLQGLRSGTPLIEIDYLHQSPPLLPHLPSYPQGDLHAQPYWVIRSDPRPTLQQGQVAYYAVGLLQPLPQLEIPLSGADFLPFDLNQAYQLAFKRRRFYAEMLDYTQLPLAFEVYQRDDQAQLGAFMARLLAENPVSSL